MVLCDCNVAALFGCNFAQFLLLWWQLFMFIMHLLVMLIYEDAYSV